MGAFLHDPAPVQDDDLVCGGQGGDPVGDQDDAGLAEPLGNRLPDLCIGLGIHSGEGIISRSAIAKWETDKGLPDVGNLKLLGQLLNTSLDRLLDDGEEADGSVIREKYNLITYGPGCRKVKKDRVVRERFPNAKIYTLLGRQEPTELQRFADSVTDCRTTVDELIKDVSKSFYLIETDGRQLFVTLTDSYIETRPLEQPLESSSFSIDGWNFIRYNYEI